MNFLACQRNGETSSAKLETTTTLVLPPFHSPHYVSTQARPEMKTLSIYYTASHLCSLLQSRTNHRGTGNGSKLIF